ncbi:hypothetical protein RHS02_06835, partial [Rhizoctonia solani]
MSSTTSSAPAEPTSFEDDSPTKRSRVVLTATIGGVCILAVTIAFIAIRVTDEPILLETQGWSNRFTPNDNRYLVGFVAGQIAREEGSS